MSDTTNDTRTQHSVLKPDALAQLAGPPASVLAILVTLTGDEETTAAELAVAASLGRSTTSKALTTLEKHGLAIRTPGGHDGPRRTPDRWRATRAPESSISDDSRTSDPAPTYSEPSTTNTAESESACTGCESTPVDTTATESQDTGTDSVACVADVSADDTPRKPPHQEDEQPEAAAEEACARHNPSDNRSAAKDTLAAGARSAQPTPARLQMTVISGEKKRLAPGSLRQMVIDHLRAHPDEAFTATKISRVIERSSGAIANALVSLVQHGIAEQMSDRPRTYRIATPDGNP
ncbi:helix-turn-helix domain-containing protein [Streptomyces sp. NPDC048665]|uniref:MarR family transcriptional regulator n=1 Tax=Streptomyces sp. NPDC048665 TaxID=3155490 RepID=UPI003427565A